MQTIFANDRVQLKQDLPELGLARGDSGVVVSTWFYPNTAYEVEFKPIGELCTRRVLLLTHQLNATRH